MGEGRGVSLGMLWAGGDGGGSRTFGPEVCVNVL